MKKDPTTRFSGKVLFYDKYRPRYPEELLHFMRKEFALNNTSVIADIGSGTGISSEIFLKNGNTVYGIEPNEEMRKKAEENFREYENFISCNATAENTGLPESTADFIICAQSFHWFNRLKCKTEFSRILKIKGHVILIWNERKISGSDFSKEYDALLLLVSPDYEIVNHTQITKNHTIVFDDFYGLGNWKLTIINNEQWVDRDGLIGRTLSCSYIPEKGDPNYHVMMKGLENLYTKHESDGYLKFEYATKIFYRKSK